MDTVVTAGKPRFAIIIFSLAATIILLVAVLTSSYPPWGSFWEGRALLVALGGAAAGIAVSITIPTRTTGIIWRKTLPEVAGLGGITIFWALIVAIFNSNQNPAENPFDVPVWAELYQVILFVSCGIAWFWWHRSHDLLLPGLLMVILAATADGMLFNHYTLTTTYLFLAMTALWAGLVLFKLGLPSWRNIVMGGGIVLILITLVASIQGVSFGDSVNYIWRLLGGWFIAIGIVSLKHERERQTPLLLVLISAGLLITVLTFIRYIYLTPIIGFGNSLSFRLSVAKADSNALGAAMIMPIALLFYIRSSFPQKFRLLFWGLVLVMLIPVFLSLSKSLWMGVAFVIILGFILSGKNWKRYLLFLLVLLVLLAAMTAIFPVIRDRIFSEYSVSFRQLIWQTVFKSIFARPVLGAGPYNTFIHATFAMDLPYERVFFDRYYLTSHTHSLWLELTEGTGLVGLVSFASIVFMIFKRSSRDKNWIIAGLAGLLLSLSFMGGLSSFNLIPYDLWILFALLSKSSSRKGVWSTGLLIPVLLICGFGMAAESFKRQAEVDLTHGNLDRACVEIKQAQNLNPLSVEYPAIEANIHILDDDFPAATNSYNRCVAMSPLHPVWRGKRGVTRIVTGDYDGAITDLQIAVAGDYWGVTGFGDLHGPLAAALASAGNQNEAGRNLEMVARLFPGFPSSPWAALAQGNDGLECCLCPDFSPKGNEFERYLRCKNWLTSYAFPATSTFRQLYANNDSITRYTPIVYEQLRKEESSLDSSNTSNISPVYTLASSYFAVRYAEGKIGRDLALLYGSYTGISSNFLNLLNLGGSQSSMNQFYHIYRNLGLAIFARQSGNLALAQTLLEEASKKSFLINPHQLAYYDEEATKIARLFPEETVETLQDKLVKEIENKKLNQVKSTISKLFYDFITTNSGYDKAESLAMLLNSAPETSSGIIADLNAGFGAQPLLGMIDAYLYKLKGNEPKALERFEQAHALAPHDRLVQAGYLEALVNLNRLDEAAKYAAIYLSLEPYDMDGLVNIAQRMAQLGRTAVSQQILGHLQATFPYSNRPYLVQAFLAGLANKADEQLLALNKALSLAPTDMDTLVSLVNFHIAHADAAQATYYIDRGLEINPANLNLWMSRVALAESNNQPAQAVESARFAYTIDPTNSWVATTLAAQLLNAGQTNDAQEVINGVLSKDPNDLNALYWRAKVYEKLGKKAEALADYEKLIGSKNAPMNIYVEVANLRMEQQRPDDAIRLMQEATDLYPNDSWGWATLGDIARRGHNYDLARSALDRAIALDPGNKSYQTLRQNVEKVPLADLITDCEKTLAAGDKPGALAKAEIAAQEYPNESWAWANLAYMAREAGNNQRARTAIAKAIELAPGNKTWQNLRREIEK
jgi:tetratricopeptide (TPR) repeat protein/O-antigen ligase